MKQHFILRMGTSDCLAGDTHRKGNKEKIFDLSLKR